MRRKLIAGNWKMNGELAANAALLAAILKDIGQPNCETGVCVPAPYLAQCRDVLEGSGLVWGGQDLSIHDAGAFTGEVSASMLCNFGSKIVIVGHSERRTYHAETDEQVGEKTRQALKHGLTPIVCVGETLDEREAGETNNTVCRQLGAVLTAIEKNELSRIVVAYEPVWAIGTGKTATPEMAQEVHAVLRARMRQKDEQAAEQVRILYGGSMKPDNAAELMAMADIDGGLIGGASLKAADFLAIIRAAC